MTDKETLEEIAQLLPGWRWVYMCGCNGCNALHNKPGNCRNPDCKETGCTLSLQSQERMLVNYQSIVYELDSTKDELAKAKQAHDATKAKLAKELNGVKYGTPPWPPKEKVAPPVDVRGEIHMGLSHSLTLLKEAFDGKDSMQMAVRVLDLANNVLIASHGSQRS